MSHDFILCGEVQCTMTQWGPEYQDPKLQPLNCMLTHRLAVGVWGVFYKDRNAIEGRCSGGDHCKKNWGEQCKSKMKSKVMELDVLRKEEYCIVTQIYHWSFWGSYQPDIKSRLLFNSCRVNGNWMYLPAHSEFKTWDSTSPKKKFSSHQPPVCWNDTKKCRLERSFVISDMALLFLTAASSPP